MRIINNFLDINYKTTLLYSLNNKKLSEDSEFRDYRTIRHNILRGFKTAVESLPLRLYTIGILSKITPGSFEYAKSPDDFTAQDYCPALRQVWFSPLV